MTQTTYIKKHKINVILPENKTIDDFNTDYDMWGGSLVDLKNEGYDFPELDKKEKKVKQTQEENKALQEKKKNNKKAQKERYNTDKYSRKSNPFYKKDISERKQLQKQYQDMMKEEKSMKDNRMKEIMEHMSSMSEDQRQEYLKTLLDQNQITTEQ